MFTILSVVSGMFLTNDITVLTLVPLYLKIAKKYKLPQIFPVTLIGMGANIGAAFTPWGNPHNLFVVDHFNVDFLTFFSWSAHLLLFGLVLLAFLILAVKKRPIPVESTQDLRISWKPTLVTTILSFFFFFGVFKVVPIWLPALAVIGWALILNPRIMTHVDYSLLLTFTCFFIFISDIQQIQPIVLLVSKMMFSEHSVYLTSILTSQVISNVPSTILVGKFTNFAKALFYGSNIGGFGSVVGSMANMLVFKTFSENGTVKRSRFFGLFSLLEFGVLAILTFVGWFFVKN